MQGKLVKEYIDKMNLNKSEISRKLGISPQHLTNMLKSPDITTDTLQKISLACGINFFGLITMDSLQPIKPEIKTTKSTKILGNNNVAHSYNNATIIHQNEEITQLKNQLKEKDKMIKELKNIIIQIKK